jgi:hypothetical protein
MKSASRASIFPQVVFRFSELDFLPSPAHVRDEAPVPS